MTIPPSRYARLAGAYHARRLWAASLVTLGLAAVAVSSSDPWLWGTVPVGGAIALHALWRMRRPGTGALDAVLLDSTAALAFLSLTAPPAPVSVAFILYMATPAVTMLERRPAAWMTAYALLGVTILPWITAPSAPPGDAGALLGVVVAVAAFPMIVWMFDLLGRSLASVGMLREQLASTRSRFEDLFQRSTVAMFRSDPDGRLLDGNRALWELFGAPDFATLVSEPVRRRYADPLDRGRLLDDLAENGRVRGFEVVMRRMDGTSFRGRISASLCSTAYGSVLEGIVEDVSDRRPVGQARPVPR